MRLILAGMIDEEGYVHIMSRSDDIINVAAHRLSTGISPYNKG
jgi:propionyl-CoA synthetase